MGLYRAMDASRERSSPCRRRRQELGVNKNPPLDKGDFDVEEGGFLLNDRVYVFPYTGEFHSDVLLNSEIYFITYVFAGLSLR